MCPLENMWFEAEVEKVKFLSSFKYARASGLRALVPDSKSL